MNKIKLRPAPAVAVSAVDKTEKQKARLKNWARFGECLVGNVYDHPRVPDGEFVTTSRLLWIDTTLKVAETRNTVYILEGPPA